MSKGCVQSSKKGCGGPAAGRAARIDKHSVIPVLKDDSFQTSIGFEFHALAHQWTAGAPDSRLF